MSATLVQISDCHLFEEEEGEIYGVNCARGFERVCDLIRDREQAPDLLLATGDISHDGSEASYRRFEAGVLKMGCERTAWLSGNHDLPERMALFPAAAPGEWMQRCIALAGWQIVMLQSRVEGRVDGELGDRDLGALRDLLESLSEVPVVICLHHHPVPCGSWLDRYILANGEALMGLVARFDCVRAILFGHIHQEFDAVHEGIRLLGVPATSAQAMPGAQERAMEDVAPGYRALELHANGAFDTAVVRCGDPD